jgi:hypothetical protein
MKFRRIQLFSRRRQRKKILTIIIAFSLLTILIIALIWLKRSLRYVFDDGERTKEVMSYLPVDTYYFNLQRKPSGSEIAKAISTKDAEKIVTFVGSGFDEKAEFGPEIESSFKAADLDRLSFAGLTAVSIASSGALQELMEKKQRLIDAPIYSKYVGELANNFITRFGLLPRQIGSDAGYLDFLYLDELSGQNQGSLKGAIFADQQLLSESDLSFDYRKAEDFYLINSLSQDKLLFLTEGYSLRDDWQFFSKLLAKEAPEQLIEIREFLTEVEAGLDLELSGDFYPWLDRGYLLAAHQFDDQIYWTLLFDIQSNPEKYQGLLSKLKLIFKLSQLTLGLEYQEINEHLFEIELQNQTLGNKLTMGILPESAIGMITTLENYQEQVKINDFNQELPPEIAESYFLVYYSSLAQDLSSFSNYLQLQNQGDYYLVISPVADHIFELKGQKKN